MDGGFNRTPLIYHLPKKDNFSYANEKSVFATFWCSEVHK